MTTVLIPIDNVAESAVAVSSVLMRARRERLDVHLVHVQPPLTSYITRFFNRRVIRDFHREVAEQQLGPVRRPLDAARLAYTVHLEIGDLVPTVARKAAELRADEIVLATDGGSVSNVLQSWRAAQIGRRAASPVVLVMPPQPPATPYARDVKLAG